MEARQDDSCTHDIYSFIAAIDAGELNRKAIESLIRAGAFDDIDPNRALMMAVCDDAVQRAQKKAKLGNKDQISIFQLEEFEDETFDSPPMPRVADFSKDVKLAMEKEMLGVYLSGHPLDEYASLIRDNTSAGTSELTGGGEEFTAGGEDADSMVINTSKFRDGDRVIMAGMVSGVRTMVTRKSQEMARMTLEDFDGAIDVIVFPKVYERKRNLVANDRIVGISGRVSFKDESDAEILAEDIVPIENIRELGRGRGNGYGDRNGYGNGDHYSSGSGYGGGDRYNGRDAGYDQRQRPQAPSEPLNDPVKLRVPQEVVDSHGDERSVLMHLTDMFGLYPGTRDVLVYLPGRKPVRVNSSNRIDFTDDLRAKLVRLLGEDNVKG
jgi:DNA polymerase-3 subunit alpha